MPTDTRRLILEAARTRLLAEGYAGLSTRKVAAEAGVPLSQLHYHFGSKRSLILSLLEEENRRLLDRQTRMYAEDEPLSLRYERACDFLEDDLESGYVRVLQEMMAAGWSDPAIREAVQEFLGGWLRLLTEVADEAQRRYGTLGPFTPGEVASLIGIAFLGGEALILLGFDGRIAPIRAGLRRVGELIRQLEENPS
jgi:AcrR family transcriptional regulator